MIKKNLSQLQKTNTCSDFERLVLKNASGYFTLKIFSELVVVVVLVAVVVAVVVVVAVDVVVAAVVDNVNDVLNSLTF